MLRPIKTCFRKDLKRWLLATSCLLALLPPQFQGQAQDSLTWIDRIEKYPVGQSDPFADELHRLQVLRLYEDEMGYIGSRFPNWPQESTLMFDFFPKCYQSLQLRFDPHDYQERGQFRFDRDFEPHKVDPSQVTKNNRTYSIHVDRYSDPRWEGKHTGAILLVPGTGSYGGNYVKFGLSMACLKGYIVYIVDLVDHGRSHGHKIVRKVLEGEGTGVFLDRAITPDGTWAFDAALEQGWMEIDNCKLKMNQYVSLIQAVGRRIAKREEDNLAHLNDQIRALPEEARGADWFGKTTGQLTHLTLIGTSQGGETAFWSADPRTTGQGQQAAFGILYPFDSVICHDLFNTAFTAPQKRMRMLRSAALGGVSAFFMQGKDSLWANADWSQFYGGAPLFLRTADRWVRWRYDMDAYQDLLRYGINHRDTLPQNKLPILVAIGQGDRLYPSDQAGERIVHKLFDKLNRGENRTDTLSHLEFLTPPDENGHQLLVHHTFEFVDLADSWIRYRRGGKGSPFEFDTGWWVRKN